MPPIVSSMVGQVLDHYRILEKIGEGGMGVVYRAHDERLDRDVALKVLPAGMLADDAARRRLRREAQALARLNHPHIETVHDFDTDDAVDFLVMELVPGPTLADRLLSGPLDEREVVRLGLQLAMALEEAHGLGVVHRDLKPGNIKITPKGQVKVLDFGLAALLRPAAESDATRSTSVVGTVAGTLPYMAPEQLRGQPVDARSDIYAAGVVLYEMATGRRPFQGRVTTEVTDAILHAAPPPPTRIRPELSQRLEDIVVKCLDKDPENRYQSAKELGVDLRRLAAPSTPPEAMALPVNLRRHSRPAAALAVTGIAVLVLVSAIVGLNVGGWRDRLFGGDTRPAILSVAVLPFENLSGDPQNVYFSDGMAAEILSRLVSIPELTVKSVRRVQGQSPDAKRVGRDFDVAAVLEGDVRREGNRVRVTARLTNTETGQVMWASEPYDRELADIFAVQSSVALQIAGALNTTLTPTVREAVERRPTKNVEAYDAYLRGLSYYRRSQEERDLRAAAASFERAVDLDPTFAAAHAMLSRVHSLLWWLYYDRTPDRVALAKAAVDRAVVLQPENPDVHAALGYYYYWCHLDYDRAQTEFAVVLKGRPSDNDVLLGTGFVLRRQGKFREAVATLTQAAELEPQHATRWLNLGETSALIRDFAQAERSLDRSIALTPDWARPYGLKARYALRLAGDVARARVPLSRAASLTLREDRDVAYASILLALFGRDYQAGLNDLSLESHETFDNQLWFIPKALLQAQLCSLLGQREAQLSHYRAAVKLLEARVRSAPDDARFHGSLGIAYAGVGRKADAIREGRQALALLPVSKDAYRGPLHVEEMARIYAMVGERDAAVEQLEYLMSIPFDLGPAGLRADPTWDTLRDHPRFQKLVSR
jgi:serine/threonine protein kinase/Tfp pilus assembly protein PilF